MNDNVSRNTFSVKFLKFPKLEHNLIKELLTQNLGRAIDLYQQTKNIYIDLNLIHIALDRKITLFFSQSSNIIYRCTIAFPLAKYVGQSPAIVAEELVDLLFSLSASSLESLKFKVTTTGGRIDFLCEVRTLVSWLDWAVAKPSSCQTLFLDSSPQKTESTQRDSFFLQYAHVRCCSWLRLGEREGLITLRDRSFSTLVWQIAQPHSIVWLDTSGNIYFTEPAEYRLLFELLIADDKLASDSGNWLKIASNLSEAMLVFEAECQIFGAIKQNEPQRAIARLSLVALVQYYLQKLLVNKIGVAAFAEL